MAKVSRLVEVIAKGINEPPEVVGLYARKLIDAGLLPKGRGSRSGWAGPEHAATLLLALLATERPTDGPTRVRELGALPQNGATGEITLLDALTQHVEAAADINYESWHALHYAQISVDRGEVPGALIRWAGDRQEPYRLDYETIEQMKEAGRASHRSVRCELSLVILCNIGAMFAGLTHTEALLKVKEGKPGD